MLLMKMFTYLMAAKGSSLAPILLRVDDVLWTSLHLFAVLGLCGLLLYGITASGIFSSKRKKMLNLNFLKLS